MSTSLVRRRLSAVFATLALAVGLLATVGATAASASTVGNPTVSVTPTSTNATAKYTVNFTTSASGALVGGTDKITLAAPAGISRTAAH